jgi:hypothetical protein
MVHQEFVETERRTSALGGWVRESSMNANGGASLATAHICAAVGWF